MKNSDAQEKREIPETAGPTVQPHDHESLGRQIIKTLSDILYVESSVFIPTYENSNDLNFNEIMLNNIDNSNIDGLKAHYAHSDVWQKITESYHQKDVVRLEELMNFDDFISGEYYNVFYRPNGIFHKIVVNLSTKNKLYATLCLHRPQSAPKFSEKEIKTVKAIIPHLTCALENYDLQKKISVKKDIINAIADSCTYCVIILDHVMRPLYINQRAEQIIKDKLGLTAFRTEDGNIPPSLLEDCYRIKDESESLTSKNLPIMPRQKVIKGTGAAKLSISSRLIAESANATKRRLYMITIEEIVAASKGIDRDALRDRYGLTDRELEIALNVFKGMKNAEIAKKLYVSEITIKWHLQNVFQKLDVKSRTALTHKMILHVHGGYRFGIY